MKICSVISEQSGEYQSQRRASPEISRLDQSRFFVEYIHSGILQNRCNELRAEEIVFPLICKVEEYTEHTHEVISISIWMLLESGKLLLDVFILLLRHIKLIYSASRSLVLSKYSFFYVLTYKSTVKWIVYALPCKTVHLIKAYIQSKRCMAVRLPRHQLYKIRRNRLGLGQKYVYFLVIIFHNNIFQSPILMYACLPIYTRHSPHHKLKTTFLACTSS